MSEATDLDDMERAERTVRNMQGVVPEWLRRSLAGDPIALTPMDEKILAAWKARYGTENREAIRGMEGT